MLGCSARAGELPTASGSVRGLLPGHHRPPRPATWARADNPATRDRVAGLRRRARASPPTPSARCRVYSLQTQLSQAERRVARSRQRARRWRASASRRGTRSRSRVPTPGGAKPARLSAGSSTPRGTSIPRRPARRPVPRRDRVGAGRPQPPGDPGQGHHRPARPFQGCSANGSARLAARETELRGLLADARSTRAAVAAARDARAAYLAGLRHQQQLNDAQISSSPRRRRPPRI